LEDDVQFSELIPSVVFANFNLVIISLILYRHKYTEREKVKDKEKNIK
jgi:hypothetical protein